MEQVAVVTGADRGLGFSLCEGLVRRGWKVFAGQFMPDWPELRSLEEKYPELLKIVPLDVSSDCSVEGAARYISENAGHADLLINNAGIHGMNGDIRDGMEFDRALQVYNINSLGPVRMVEAFLPLMEKGMRRLCFVSSEAGSIGVCTRNGGFNYCMSKTALNMAIRIMFNHLHPEGYTFRIYHPGWLRSYMSGVKNTRGLLEPEESAAAALPQFIEGREDEDCLVMIDYRGEAWPF